MSEQIRVYSVRAGDYILTERVEKSEEEWRKQLTPEQFEVTRHHGTERSCSGALLQQHEEGVYHCVCCGNDLFLSGSKFESGTGWPSFFQPVAPENITAVSDTSFGMVRTSATYSKTAPHPPACATA